MFVASIAHDLGHIGINNSYKSKMGSIVAKTVNDQSVLEHYHSYNLFHTLEQEDTNILENLTYAQKNEFRKIAIEGILGTDMAQHFSIVENFKKTLEKIRSGSELQQPDKFVRLCLNFVDLSEIPNSCK